jgi:glycosyltransferase involved in cell wall biosynthesis
MLKIHVVGIVGLPPMYGGFETLVNYLTLNNKGSIHFTVYCQKNTSENKLLSFNNADLVYLPLKANGFQSIIYDSMALMRSWFTADVILILGTPGSIVLPVLRVFRNTKTIINFGGLEWKRSKWNIIVRMYLRLTEYLAIKFATIVIADNQFFCDHIIKSYNRKPILIEYGGDHVNTTPQANDSASTKYPFINDNYDVSVSRAQHDNNLHIVLDAYKQSNRKIVLISNFNSSNYGKEIKKNYSNKDNIILLDAIYDQSELDIIRSRASLYIHSHLFCGTAPSLVEAMSFGSPILCFDNETNRYTTENNCQYFNDVESLIRILDNIDENYLNTNSKKMLEIAQSRYKWDRVSKMYYELFK